MPAPPCAHPAHFLNPVTLPPHPHPTPTPGHTHPFVSSWEIVTLRPPPPPTPVVRVPGFTEPRFKSRPRTTCVGGGLSFFHLVFIPADCLAFRFSSICFSRCWMEGFPAERNLILQKPHLLQFALLAKWPLRFALLWIGTNSPNSSESYSKWVNECIVGIYFETFAFRAVLCRLKFFSLSTHEFINNLLNYSSIVNE